MSVLVRLAAGIPPPDIGKSASDYSERWLENRRSRLGAFAASMVIYQLPMLAGRTRRGPIVLEGVGFVVLDPEEFDIARIRRP